MEKVIGKSNYPDWKKIPQFTTKFSRHPFGRQNRNFSPDPDLLNYGSNRINMTAGNERSTPINFRRSQFGERTAIEQMPPEFKAAMTLADSQILPLK